MANSPELARVVSVGATERTVALGARAVVARFQVRGARAAREGLVTSVCSNSRRPGHIATGERTENKSRPSAITKTLVWERPWGNYDTAYPETLTRVFYDPGGQNCAIAGFVPFCADGGGFLVGLCWGGNRLSLKWPLDAPDRFGSSSFACIIHLTQ
jgi:hypothetical protein